MTRTTISRALAVTPRMEEAWQAVDACFGRFCLTAGIEALHAMMAADVEDLCGGGMPEASSGAATAGAVRAARSAIRAARSTSSGHAFGGGGGEEMPLPSWTAAISEDWLGKTAMNLMLIGVATRKIGRAVRPPEGPLIQRCQVHKARNIAERCPRKHGASVRRTLREAWELDDAAEAERLIRDLAQRMEKEAPGVSGSMLKGLDEMLTVNRLRLPPELRRSLACTNAIETCWARSVA